MQRQPLTWFPSLPFEAWPPWSSRCSFNPIFPIWGSAHILGHCRAQRCGQHSHQQPVPSNLHGVPARSKAGHGQLTCGLIHT